MPDAIAGEFAFDATWDAIQALLSAQLPQGTDVAPAGEKDFDDEDNLILTPPAVRGVFVLSRAEQIETQALAYSERQEFAVMCVDQDLSADTQAQRRSSAQLAAQVKHILVGARITLPDGSICGPLVYVATEPFPVRDIGFAYIVGFEVPGIAQFAGPNATPTGE